MKLWIVNHPYPYRRWLKVEARVLGKQGWHEGFIWSEWFGTHDDGEFHVPRVPRTQLTEANIDPLVIGRHMYFDYCRKGGNGKNERQRNELVRGDLILFGCVNQGDLIIDTVFVVGDTRQWEPRDAPAWSDLDLLAQRVHFHPAAHEQQHPEVHATNAVSARSYRGERADPNLFCWVPFRAEPPTASRPLILPRTSSAYRLLSNAYAGLVLEDAMMGSFGVVNLSNGAALFDAIRDEACSQGFDVAVEMRLPGELEEAAPAELDAPCGTPETVSSRTDGSTSDSGPC